MPPSGNRLAASGQRQRHRIYSYQLTASLGLKRSSLPRHTFRSLMRDPARAVPTPPSRVHCILAKARICNARPTKRPQFTAWSCAYFAEPPAATSDRLGCNPRKPTRERALRAQGMSQPVPSRSRRPGFRLHNPDCACPVGASAGTSELGRRSLSALAQLSRQCGKPREAPRGAFRFSRVELSCTYPGSLHFARGVGLLVDTCCARITAASARGGPGRRTRAQRLLALRD